MLGRKKIITCILLGLLSFSSYAQTDKLQKAFEYYSAKNLDSARILIDASVANPETAQSYQAWMVRGFIYKELYKTGQANDPVSPFRDTASTSLMKALSLDAQGENSQKASVIQSLKYIASTYHNDINKTLDTSNYEISVLNAEKYKSIAKIYDSHFDEKKYNYDVYSTIGSMFEKSFELSTSQNSLDLAKAFLQKAYEINNSTTLINKNLGVLYYNQAVDIIKKMDYDVPLDQLPAYQDKSVALGKQALPYLLKAYQISPSDKSVVEGLAGIYYLLNETNHYNQYKTKLEELNKQ